MSLDLSSSQSSAGQDGTFRMGLDAEKIASLLEQMAAGIRSGIVQPRKCEVSSVFMQNDWERGRLLLEFNEKVES